VLDFESLIQGGVRGSALAAQPNGNRPLVGTPTNSCQSGMTYPRIVIPLQLWVSAIVPKAGIDLLGSRSGRAGAPELSRSRKRRQRRWQSIVLQILPS